MRTNILLSIRFHKFCQNCLRARLSLTPLNVEDEPSSRGKNGSEPPTSPNQKMRHSRSKNSRSKNSRSMASSRAEPSTLKNKAKAKKTKRSKSAKKSAKKTRKATKPKPRKSAAKAAKRKKKKMTVDPGQKRLVDLWRGGADGNAGLPTARDGTGAPKPQVDAPKKPPLASAVIPPRRMRRAAVSHEFRQLPPIQPRASGFSQPSNSKKEGEFYKLGSKVWQNFPLKPGHGQLGVLRENPLVAGAPRSTAPSATPRNPKALKAPARTVLQRPKKTPAVRRQAPPPGAEDDDPFGDKIEPAKPALKAAAKTPKPAAAAKAPKPALRTPVQEAPIAFKERSRVQGEDPAREADTGAPGPLRSARYAASGALLSPSTGPPCGVCAGKAFFRSSHGRVVCKLCKFSFHLDCIDEKVPDSEFTCLSCKGLCKSKTKPDLDIKPNPLGLVGPSSQAEPSVDMNIEHNHPQMVRDPKSPHLGSGFPPLKRRRVVRSPCKGSEEKRRRILSPPKNADPWPPLNAYILPIPKTALVNNENENWNSIA